MGRSTVIAQTLLQNGKANVNAYNADVSIILYIINVIYTQIQFCYVCLIVNYDFQLPCNKSIFFLFNVGMYIIN